MLYSANNYNERKLTERETAVLCAIVFEHIVTGKPIGSRSFVQKYSFNLSPATMRNIMYDLESLGYVMQPHTSAGRIPTDLGYRYYVDSLLDSYEFILDESLKLNEDFIKKEIQLDKIFSSITRMLSMVSEYAGIVLSPKPDFTVVKHIELVPLSETSVFFILVTRTGVVLNRKVNISESVSLDDLHKFSKFLTSELNGFAIYDIKDNLFKQIRDKLSVKSEFHMALDIAQIAFGTFDQQDIFIEGIENILHIPEMVEHEKLKAFFHLIERKENLIIIMQKSMREEGIHTFIGQEIENENVMGCSLVTSSYKIGDKQAGTLGVLGPTRMNYKKVLPLVDYASKMITDLLTKISK